MSADVHPAERSAEISSQRANVGPRRTVDDTTPHAARSFDRLDVEAVDPHRTRRTIDLLALTGQLVKPLAVDLDRRDHRRHLHQIPGEAVGSSTHLIVGDRRHVVGGGDLAGSVEGRRLRPEHDLTLVALRQLGEKPQQAGGVSHAEHQHTGCVGVKRARVTDLPSADHTAGLGDDIVAGPARRLVDHDDTVGPALLVFVPIPSLARSTGVEIGHRWALGLLTQDLLDARRRPQRRVRAEFQFGRATQLRALAHRGRSRPRYSSNASSISGSPSRSKVVK